MHVGSCSLVFLLISARGPIRREGQVRRNLQKLIQPVANIRLVRQFPVHDSTPGKRLGRQLAGPSSDVGITRSSDGCVCKSRPHASRYRLDYHALVHGRCMFCERSPVQSDPLPLHGALPPADGGSCSALYAALVATWPQQMGAFGKRRVRGIGYSLLRK